MIKLDVNNIILDIYEAIIGTVTDEKTFKENLGKIFSKEEMSVIVNELKKEPHTVSLFVPFKQFIVRVQLSKVVGQQRVMIFYNCKNDLSIAKNICKGFDDWDDITRETFMNTFYAVLANYNQNDLAELHVVT
jgi:hypothetical protein